MKILLFCGKKQTGKSSAAKFLCGLSLQKNGFIEKFSQNENGDILIPVDDGWGILDVYSKNEQHEDWFKYALWPNIKPLSFATELKESIHRIFGIERSVLYGSDEDKNKKTKIKVKQILKFLNDENKEEYEKLNKNSFISVRQLMQIFGTDICRSLDADCWVKIIADKTEGNSKIYTIDDCRFESEYQYKKFVNNENVIPILFIKDEENDSGHSSEKFQFNPDDFELVLNKSKMTMLEKCEKLEDFLLSKGVFEIEV